MENQLQPLSIKEEQRPQMNLSAVPPQNFEQKPKRISNSIIGFIVIVFLTITGIVAISILPKQEKKDSLQKYDATIQNLRNTTPTLHTTLKQAIPQVTKTQQTATEEGNFSDLLILKATKGGSIGNLSGVTIGACLKAEGVELYPQALTSKFTNDFNHSYDLCNKFIFSYCNSDNVLREMNYCTTMIPIGDDNTVTRLPCWSSFSGGCGLKNQIPPNIMSINKATDIAMNNGMREFIKELKAHGISIANLEIKLNNLHESDNIDQLSAGYSIYISPDTKSVFNIELDALNGSVLKKSVK